MRKYVPRPSSAPALLRFAAPLALALLTVLPAAAQVTPRPAAQSAAGASDWSHGLSARMRLIDGGPVDRAGQSYRAGVEVQLDPYFKTYWRTPGDSGLPPIFDWSASQNVAEVQVSWPAPSRFEDTAGSSIGYREHVVFPLSVRAADPAQPVTLVLKLDYAVCEKVCIPVKGEARLGLSKAGLSTPHMLAIAEAEARIPASAQIGDAHAPALRTVEAGADRKALLVTALVPEKASIVDIFAEGPDGWVFGAPVAISTLPQAPGVRLVSYRIPADAAPKDGDVRAIPLQLTMTADDVAIETSVTLGAGKP